MARSIYRGDWKYANWKAPWRGPQSSNLLPTEAHEKRLMTLFRKMMKVNEKERVEFPEGCFLIIDKKEKSAAVIPADDRRARDLDFRVPGYNVTAAIRNLTAPKKDANRYSGYDETGLRGLPPIFGDNEAAGYNAKTYKQEYTASFFPGTYPEEWSNEQDLEALEELAQVERARTNVKEVVGNLDMLISSLLGQGMAKKSWGTDYYGKTHSCTLEYKNCTVTIESRGNEEV